ncbi:MAG: ABC transporter ATP-binding protein [Candidatus Uhrbacteria bacterium]
MEEEPKQRVSPRRTWRALRPVVAPCWGWIALVVLLSVAASCLVVSEPYLYGRIVDSVSSSVARHVAPSSGFATIVPLLGWWAGIVLVESLLVAFAAWIGWYVGNLLEKAVGARSFERFLALSISRFQDERAGAMMNRFVHGEEAVWGLNNQILRTAIPSLATFCLIVGVGLHLDWRLTLASLALVPVDIAIGFYHLYVSIRKQDVMSDKWEETTGLVGDAFSNITTVQGEAGETAVMGRFAKSYAKVLREQLHINVRWATVDAGTSFVNISGRLITFVVGVQLVFAGTTSLGTLVTFLGFVSILYASVQNVFGGLPEIARSFNRLDRLTRIWDEEPEVRDRDVATKAPALLGRVEFDKVGFSYCDGGKSVLRDVSFSIPAGKTFAIIGESGAGKSTLAKLMVRFADPTRGAIRVDGIDLRDMTLASLRPQVGFVMQENMLFHDTILYNMRFAKPKATREEVIAAAKRAQAHEFISKLPKGYDTVVGERGVKLSGGQKQRIALARVLLANPPILVLDEATSALDSKTEHDLQKALKEVMRNRTTIVIAHRLSTVMDADNILVMDKGKIVDQGTHEHLIKRDNLYRQFWEIQAGGYV